MDPDVPATLEPAIWRPEIAPGTLMIVAAPDGFYSAMSFDLSRIGGLVLSRGGDADCHLIIRAPDGDYGIWLNGADAARRPALILPLDAAFELRINVMTRFYRRLLGHPAGSLPNPLQLPPLRRSRLIQLLHALDFRLAGAGPRDIAAALIDAKDAALPATEWKSSATRRKANRLISDALALMNGGYRGLLRGD